MTEPSERGCCTACQGTGNAGGYPCEDCYATGHCHPGPREPSDHPIPAVESDNVAGWTLKRAVCWSDIVRDIANNVPVPPLRVREREEGAA